jgi:hypothetical protein
MVDAVFILLTVAFFAVVGLVARRYDTPGKPGARR